MAESRVRAYSGLAASAWDLLRGDTSEWPDRGFYREVIERSGQPVLDVGCATGRLLLDYMADGIEIDGVDASPEMLDLCRAKAAAQGLTPTLFRQPMHALDLGQRYATILVPSSTFQLMIDPAQAASALEHFLAHLLPGGTLVMSFMEVWREGEPLRHEHLAAEAVRGSDGATIRHTETTEVEPERKIAVTRNLYEVLVEDRVEASESHDDVLRSYGQEEICTAVAVAGFIDVRAVRGFSWQPAIPDNRIFCVLARKPSRGDSRP